MNEKLLMCPFCGGEARIWKSDKGYRKDFSVSCLGCKVQGWIFRTEQEAINAWNTRVKE